MNSQRLHVLFVCSRNQWRSVTAENMYATDPRLMVRSAGTETCARRHITEADVVWADVVFTMERDHSQQLRDRFPKSAATEKLVCLNITNNFQLMDPELQTSLRYQVDAVIQERLLNRIAHSARERCKAIFVDLDGTMLHYANPDKPSIHGCKLSEFSQQIVAQLTERGIPVVAITGRSVVSTRRALTGIWPTSIPIACLNGAIILDGLHGESLRELNLEIELMEAINAIARQTPTVANLVFDTAETFYAWDKGLGTEDLVNDYGNKGYSFSLASEIPCPINGALLHVPVGQQETFDIICEHFGHRANVTAYGHWPWIEVSHPEAGKGATLRKMCNDLGLTPHEVMAFGDGPNDVDMLKTAGLGVAVANASTRVKASADLIIESNAHDGVAHFLKKVFLSD